MFTKMSDIIMLFFSGSNYLHQGSNTCHRVFVYIIHFCYLAVEAGFYSDIVECLPVDPETWIRFPAGTGKIFLLYDNGAHRK